MTVQRPHVFDQMAVTGEDLETVFNIIKGDGETTPLAIAQELNKSEQWVWRAIDKLERAQRVRCRVQKKVLFVSVSAA